MTDRNRIPYPESLAAQALGWEDADGGLAPAIQPATTYLRQKNSNQNQFSYSRADNPTYHQVEALLSKLEGGAETLLFASGMAATVALFQSLPAGAGILANEVMYWGVRHWLNTTGKKQGLQVHYFPTGDLAVLRALASAENTDLIWIESPANPMWQITDIAQAAEIAQAAGARLAVDNTVATPVLTRPLALGADYVMHSGTKYLNGHSDTIAGTLTTRQIDEQWQQIIEQRTYGGAVLGPFESWLLLRGMRTLYLRVRAAGASAMTIAEHFQGHANIHQVLYPGLTDFPGHDIATQQMQDGYSGMLSLRVNGGEEAAANIVERTQIWKRATSLGGVESLIEHRAPVEGPGSPVPKDLLRLSTGIEHVDDLIADLEAALA